MRAFLSDYTVQLSDTNQTSLKRATPVDLCESCDSKEKAVAYCCDCPAHLCESCVTSHQAVKFLRAHKVEHNILSENISKRCCLSIESKTIYCNIHPDKKFELYCKTCQCVTCLLCFVNYHNGHDHSNIDSDTRIEVQGQIEELVNQVEAKLSEFEEDLTYINQIEEDKTKESISLKEEINKSFDSLVAAIEARRTALVEEVEAASVKDLKEVWAQKEVVETSIIASRGALALATRSLQCTNDLELLLLGAQVNKRLKELSGKSWDPTPLAATEISSKEFSLNIPSGIEELGQIKVSISKCSITMGETFILGEPITFLCGTSKHKKLNLQPRLRVLHGRSKVDIPNPPMVVPDQTKGAFSVTFTPVVSGEHVVVVEGKAKDWEKRSIISVTGEPSIGARVQRGPDWSYGKDDVGKFKEGTIAEESDEQGYDFVVLWDVPNEMYYHRWGCGKKYDFELVL